MGRHRRKRYAFKPGDMVVVRYRGPEPATALLYRDLDTVLDDNVASLLSRTWPAVCRHALVLAVHNADWFPLLFVLNDGRLAWSFACEWKPMPKGKRKPTP